ncbi:MAG TPA: hypothetical protein VK403_06455 [Allosphingosinicella sp.]|nr:hypothetical protein [Allosphingosinicella sp.]
MRIVHALCVGFLVAATPAIAEDRPAPGAAAKDKIICKRTRVTGSLAGSAKVCGTREFWEDRTRRSKEWTRDLTDKKQPPAWE